MVSVKSNLIALNSCMAVLSEQLRALGFDTSVVCYPLTLWPKPGTPQGCVELTAQKPGQGVSITVQANGSGVVYRWDTIKIAVLRAATEGVNFWQDDLEKEIAKHRLYSR